MSCLILSMCLLAAAGPAPGAGLCPECGNPMTGSVLTDNPRPESLNMRFVGNWPFGAPHAVATDTARSLAFCASGTGVLVLDISEPARPRLVSSALRTRRRVERLCYNHADSTIYLGVFDDSVEVWNVSDPLSPARVGGIDVRAHEFVVAGQLGFFSCGWRGLSIYDISDPADPALLGSCDDADWGYLSVVDTLVYLGGSSQLSVVSVADPTRPAVVGRLYVNCGDLVVAGDWVYTTGWEIHPYRTGIFCIDVSDPTRPELAHIEETENWNLVYLRGQYLVLPYDGGLKVYDVETPGRPAFRGHRRYQCGAEGLDFKGSYAFAASGDWPPYEHGLWVFDLSDPSDPVSIARYLTPQTSSAIAVVGSYGLLVDPTPGLRILDLSDMTCPVEVGTLAVGDPSCGIVVKDTLAYVAAGREGLIVLDVSSPLEPEEVGRLNLVGWAYGVHLHDTLALVAARGLGLNIVNVADPAHPELVVNWDTTFYVYAADIFGQHAFLAAGAGLHILDVSDLTAPLHVGQYDYVSYGGSDVAVKDDYAWVSFLCGGCGAGGIGVLDVSDPENPDSVDIVGWGAPTDIDLRGDYLFVAGGAVGVFDVSNPSSLDLVAYCSTPWTPGVEWLGLWVVDNHLLCACASQGLQIYEATDIGIAGREGTPPHAGIRLLENPVRDRTIRLAIVAPDISEVTLYNSCGRLAGKFPVSDRGETRIPVHDMAAGTYFLRAGRAGSLKVLLLD